MYILKFFFSLSKLPNSIKHNFFLKINHAVPKKYLLVYCMCITFPEVPTMCYNDLNANACSLIG